MALGWRILWQHRVPLAARHGGTPTDVFGAHRVRGRALEAGAGLRDASIAGNPCRDVAKEGLRYVEITTSPDNVPSQWVIEANGGVFVEEFVTPIALGSKASGGTVCLFQADA